MIKATEPRFGLAGVAAILTLAAIFIVDLLFLPAGYSVAALYLLAVVLTLMQRIAWLPVAIAAAASVLVVLGYALSPRPDDIDVALFNRVVGAVAPWLLAFAVWKMLVSRVQVERSEEWQRAESAVSGHLVGEQTLASTADQASLGLCESLGADTAVLYRLDGDTLLRCGGYALDRTRTPERIALGEGVVGQVATDGQWRAVSGMDERRLAVSFGQGSVWPASVLVAPICSGGQTLAVVELGYMREPDRLADHARFIDAVSEHIAVALRAAHYHERVQFLLEKSQEQAEALQAQQEELRVSNEELEEQGRVLRDSQARLETQQSELEQVNVQLEERTQTLQRQRAQLLQVQQSLREQAVALEASSRYKSEFLANMSHELRTPLNSSLILSRLLADNKGGTLTEEQVGWAKAIQSANNDLLTLINEILDLAKIEAGHVEVDPAPTSLADLLERLRTIFTPLARQKELAFTVEVQPDVDDELVTDRQRLQQVLSNLLANAIKFTEQGEVALAVRAAGQGQIAFEVRDTGIGIAPEQQHAIFEAFRQADGSTSRRFGGTGLGLSIARELARRLGGDVEVSSETGRGSVFTVTVATALEAPASPPADAAARRPATPRSPAARPAGPARSTEPPGPAASPAAGERAAPAAPAAPRIERQGRERLVLIVEDDPRFSELLCQLVKEMQFDCAAAATAADALRLTRELQPSAVLLDVELPDQSGIGVLERLKQDPATRHIPVHMVSNHDRVQTALELGAVGYLKKPADREQLAAMIGQLQERLQRSVRRLLIVEDDEDLREHLRLLLESDTVEIIGVGRMDDALQALEQQSIDCMVLDLALPDGSGYELLDAMADSEQYAFPPVIVYTGRVLSRDEEQRLRRYSRSIIIKGARSPERLLDEVTLFLHSVESRLPPEQQRILKEVRQRDAVLEGRRILLVEDDVRNIFALTPVFEQLGARLEIARNGREALDKLDQGIGIDLVLMDIMMPEMDGLTAMNRIRERPALARLPVIALTAKAMPEDREQCLAAGASDYIAKPIDIDKLVSLCRVWMPK